MRRGIEIGAVLMTLCSCLQAESVPPAGSGPADHEQPAAVQSALTAEEAVEEVQDLLGDVGGFVGNGFAGFGGGGQGWQDWMDFGGLPAFEAPSGCTMDASLLGGEISFASDCTMPSGRHVQGSLHIGLGAPCAPFGFAVNFDLLVESAPGAGDEVHVSGSVNLSFADQRIYLALNLSEEVHLSAVHATDVAACVVVDLPTRILAIDGSVRHSVDGDERHGLRIEDLQASLCEHPPYTGSVRMHGPVHNAQIEFERPGPDEARITVATDGDETHLTLPVLKIPGPFCADLPPVPLALDYASCGGCGHPDPGGDDGFDDDHGGPGGPGDGAGDPDPQLPGGDPDDPLD